MPQSAARYEPLLYSDEESLATDKDWAARKPEGNIRAWALFLFACALSLAFSAASLSASLNASSFNSVNRNPTKTPSVYLGLEKLRPSTALCRGRGSYPWEFYTFQGSDTRHKIKVHAPKDDVDFSFGGHTSALIDFYFPDFGLENCTLTAQGFNDVVFDLYRLDNMDGALSGRKLISTLDFTKHRGEFELTTAPFYCPSRTHALFLWTCANPACHVDFSLKGVTHMTAGDTSRNSTGLRLTQWEHMDCIPSTAD